MKATELRTKDVAGLQQELSDLGRAHFALRMQIATQQNSNTAQLKRLRRDIARVQTVIKEKQKTVTVLVEHKVKHPVYGKYVVQSKKYHAHTETPYNEGDVVEIQEGRPVSKTKSWYVSRLLTAAKVV